MSKLRVLTGPLLFRLVPLLLWQSLATHRVLLCWRATSPASRWKREEQAGRSSMMTPRSHQQRLRLEVGDYCFPRSPHRLLHMPHKNISQIDGPAASSTGSTRAILFVSSHRVHHQTSSLKPRLSNQIYAVILRIYVVSHATTRAQTKTLLAHVEGKQNIAVLSDHAQTQNGVVYSSQEISSKQIRREEEIGEGWESQSV